MALRGEYYVLESDRIKIIKAKKDDHNVLTKNLVNRIFYEIRFKGVPAKSILAEQMSNKSYFVEICDDVWGIDSNAFRDCNFISKIRIANLSYKYATFTIGEYAFAGSNLKTLEVDNISRNLYISGGAFACCKSLTKVELLSCKSIRYGAFGECENLETIKLPQNIYYIDGNVFAGCKSLESIYIPKRYFDKRFGMGSIVGESNAQIIIYDEFNEYDEDGHVLIANKKSFKSFSGVIRQNLIANKKKNKL